MGIPIGEIGGLLRNLGGRAARALDRDQLAGAIRAGVSPRQVVRGEASWADTAKAVANSRSGQAGLGMLGLGIGGILAQSTNGIQNTLNQVGPAIDRTVSNSVPDNIENWAGRTAREMEKGGLLGMVEGAITAPFVAAQTYGQKGGYSTPSTGGTLPPDAGGRAYGTQATLNGKPVVWAGKDYGWQSPKTGSATIDALNSPGVQDRFIQDKRPIPHGGTPQDRARLEESSRIAQQTAQNPLFQKYQVADLTKQYNTAANPAEKQRIGLEIWAQTNPLLAAKLKSGQMGYAESRTAPGMSNAGGSPLGALPMPTTHFDATSAVSTPMTMDYQQTFGTPIPGVGMVSTTPQVFNPSAVQQPLSEGMIKASYGQQLFSSPDFAKVAKDSAFLRQAYMQQGLK